MQRRKFFEKSLGALCLLAQPGLIGCTSRSTGTRFGVVTDSHFARAETRGTRYYSQSTEKLNYAVEIFNKEKLDFIIELGDFKDETRPPERLETIDFLVEIESVLNRFNGPVYHVLGNHDMDSISKEDFLANINNYGQEKAKNYYSFEKGGLKFIVIDPNYNPDGSDYDSGNFDWRLSLIPDDQKEWLQNELDSTRLPVVVFTHQLLDSFSDIASHYCISNAPEITEILESNNNVAAVFQGHYHRGHYSNRNGIHYLTIQAMVEGSLPENNSFGIVEIDSDLNIIVNGFYNCDDYDLSHPEV